MVWTMHKTFSLVVAILLAVPAAGQASYNGINDRPFLQAMGSVEGHLGYDTITLATDLRPARPITRMSIAEVLEFQRRIRASGARSSALGRYQFIYTTLSYVVERNNIDTSLPFDRFTQDALARMEMERSGFYDRTAAEHDVANCLSAVWAALPLVSGPRRGQSRFAGVAGNRALISVEDFLATLSARFPDTIRMVSLSGPGARR